jgi:hypothetical protein
MCAKTTLFSRIWIHPFAPPFCTALLRRAHLLHLFAGVEMPGVGEVAPEAIAERSLRALQDRVRCFETAMTSALESCWRLAYQAVLKGLDGLDGVSTFGNVLVGAMKDVLEQGLAFVSTVIRQGFITTSEMIDVSCVLRMALLLVDEGTITEELPAKPCVLCRAFARCLLGMFNALCCLVDALVVAPTADKNLQEIAKMLVFDTMAVLAWVVEDEDFQVQPEALRRKSKSLLIGVVLRVLNKPGLALAIHSTAILEVLQDDFRREHFVLLRKFLESPAQGQAVRELRERVADIVKAIK